MSGTFIGDISQVALTLGGGDHGQEIDSLAVHGESTKRSNIRLLDDVEL